MDKQFSRFLTFPLLALASAAAGSSFTPSLISAQVVKLAASDGAAGNQFGHSAAISGDNILVGAPGGDSSGAAYLFDAATGAQVSKLVASDGAMYDAFGFSVAINGSAAIVGAPSADPVGTFSGCAYLFDVSIPSAPVQTAKLVASDAVAGDFFGTSVAISGNTAVVGTPYSDMSASSSGCVYLFNVSTGQEIARLGAGDGDVGDLFGDSIAISGDTAIVGAPFDDDSGSNSGSAYLFDTVSGQQIAKLRASDGSEFDSFGISVGISGSTAIVGAAWNDDPAVGFDTVGAAYLFDVTTGQQTGKLVASDGAHLDLFGISVGISADTAIVGARLVDASGIDSGSAYLFDTTSGQQIAEVLAIDGASKDWYGDCVGISGDTIIVGARFDDDSGADSGSAYLYGHFAASWSSRSGILGLNPPDFTCSSVPALGATWSTQVDMTPSIGSVTTLSFVAVGFGGPTEGSSVFGHELLILPPFVFFPGQGTYDFPVPPDSTLLGLSDSWQGARLEVVPSGPFFLVLTNALDVVYGM